MPAGKTYGCHIWHSLVFNCCTDHHHHHHHTASKLFPPKILINNTLVSKWPSRLPTDHGHVTDFIQTAFRQKICKCPVRAGMSVVSIRHWKWLTIFLISAVHKTKTNQVLTIRAHLKDVWWRMDGIHHQTNDWSLSPGEARQNNFMLGCINILQPAAAQMVAGPL